MLGVMEERRKITVVTEVECLRASVRYKISAHKYNKGSREEQRITDKSLVKSPIETGITFENNG
jgi:hypothetical protein